MIQTDCEYLLSVLKRGPAETTEIIYASIRDRNCSMTVHSRVADLRRQGHDIRCDYAGRNPRGRPVYRYTLIAPDPQLSLEGAA